MKVLALERDVPGVTAEQLAPHLADEAARAWELHQTGVFRELYFRQDRSSAVLVLEVQDLNEARSVLATLPLVQHGLVDFDLIPLKAYPGFARLFGSPAAGVDEPASPR